MMDQAVVRMDQLFQSAFTSGSLRADASLVLEPEVVDEEDLASEVEDSAVTDDIEGATLPDEAPARTLDDVVRSIQPEASTPRDPATATECRADYASCRTTTERSPAPQGPP